MKSISLLADFNHGPGGSRNSYVLRPQIGMAAGAQTRLTTCRIDWIVRPAAGPAALAHSRPRRPYRGRALRNQQRNRLASASKATGYQALAHVAPLPGGWSTGLAVRLHKVPFAVRLFKLVASNGDMEWVVTNNFAFTLTQPMVEATTRTRWQVEEFHRHFK